MVTLFFFILYLCNPVTCLTFPHSVQSVMRWRAANTASSVPASERAEAERAQLRHAGQTSRCGAVQHAAVLRQRFLAQATMEAGTIVFLFLLHTSAYLARYHVLLFTVPCPAEFTDVFLHFKKCAFFFFFNSAIVSVEAKITQVPYIQLGFSHCWATIQYNCD